MAKGKCDACGKDTPTAICSLDMSYSNERYGIVRVCVFLCRECQSNIDGRTVSVSRQTAEE